MNHRGVGERELEEAGKGDPVSAAGSNVISQVPGGFVDTGECKGAL